MSDVLTGTVESGVDTTAYDLAFNYALRPKLNFEAFVTKKATKQSHRGAVVTFTVMNDLAVDTTPLNEYVDVAAVGLTDSPVALTLAEYGKAAITTAKLRGTSFIDFDPSVVNRLVYNAAATTNALARNALLASTNPLTPAGTILESDDLRAAFAELTSANVEPFDDGFYVAVLPPNVAFDLKRETDAAGWRSPQVYSGYATGGIQRGEIGVYEGFRVIIDNTLTMDEDTFTYPVLFLGFEGLAKAFSEAPGFGPAPSVRPGPVTDKLNRFRPMGWYWLGQYKIFRTQAVLKLLVESSRTPSS